MAKKIGIDLGTTYSCVSYVDEMGIVRILDNREGEQTTPSVVFFEEDGRAVVGSTARDAGAMNPERIVERVKNYMGDADYRFYANGKEYSAAAVSSLILKKLIEDAELALGDEIEGAVITCPAYFGDGAKYATRAAGENVVLSNGQNLQVLRILDEPTSAAIAYCNSKHEDMDKTVLIYDLGGGTFDCTVMKITINGDEKVRQAITTGGNHQLGGKDWDAALAEIVRSKFCDATGADENEMMADPECIAWFSENIEKAKKNLTSRESTTLTLNWGGYKERIEVTREEFEEATAPLLDQTILLVNDMFEKKGMNVISDIDEIILVGGSTYMPQVTNRLNAEYNKPLTSYEPNKAVAMGAAIVASEWTEQQEAPLPIGFGGAGEEQQETPVVTDAILSKSYGLRIVSGGEYKVLNLVYKDSPKPCAGNSADAGQPLVITNSADLVDEVPILVLENTSFERIISLDECDPVFVEEPIKFDGAVPGNNAVSVEIAVDIDGIVTLSLTDLVTGRTYQMRPKRKLDDVVSIGMADAQSTSLM